MTIATVKIHKETSFKMKSGSPEKELPHTTTHHILPTPKGKRVALTGKSLFYYSSGGKEDFSLHLATDPTNEKPWSSHWEATILQTPNFLDMLFITAPSNCPLLSMKDCSPLLFSRLVYGFAVACCAQLQLSAVPE